MGRKRQRDYFTPITDLAITAYNSTDDIFKRNRIYKRFIKYAFDKLAENTIHKYKAYYYESTYEDFHSECVVHLIEKIHTYNPVKGKSFSWFTVICRNFVIQKNRKNYANLKQFDGRDEEVEIKSYSVFQDETTQDAIQEVFTKFINYVDENLFEIANTNDEMAIIDSVVDLFRRRQELFSFKKKQLYLLIRERSYLDSSKTFLITDVMKRLEAIFNDIREEVL